MEEDKKFSGAQLRHAMWYVVYIYEVSTPKEMEERIENYIKSLK